MKEKICYLHIGTMKTGTTSIQDFLWINREILATRYKILYPKSIKNYGYLNDHNVITDFFYSIDNEGNFVAPQIGELKNEIAPFHQCVISSENIQWIICGEEELKKFKNMLLGLGFTQIIVVIYLRNPADLFVSMCSQDLKDGEKEQNYCKEIDQNSKMKRLCDYRQTLIEYEKVFCKDNLRVKLFDKKEFKNGNLIEDFLECIGIPCDSDFVFPQTQNVALDLLGMKVVEKLNQAVVLPRKLVIPLAEKFFSNPSSELKFFPPKQKYQEYEKYFSNSVQWVLQNYFPHKDCLFKKRDLSLIEENYEIKKINRQDWEVSVEFLLEILKKMEEDGKNSGGVQNYDRRGGGICLRVVKKIKRKISYLLNR